MIRQNVIEEHPLNEPALLVSCKVVTPKPDGNTGITLDACNVNKVINSTNILIPRPDDTSQVIWGNNLLKNGFLKLPSGNYIFISK